MTFYGAEEKSALIEKALENLGGQAIVRAVAEETRISVKDVLKIIKTTDSIQKISGYYGETLVRLIRPINPPL